MVRVVVRWARVTDAEFGMAVLDDAERARAGRRQNPAPFVTAHVTLRQLVADHSGRAPSDVHFVRRCATCGSDRHGKPVPEGVALHVSLSYDDHWVLAAAGTDAEIGVDVEGFAATDFDGFPRVFLNKTEYEAMASLTGESLLRARATVLSRKESILKATGHGLAIDPTSIAVSAANQPPALRSWTTSPSAPERLTVVDLDPPAPTHVAALAVLACAKVTVEIA